MIAAVDAHYCDDGGATAAAVVFADFSDPRAHSTYVTRIPRVDRYVSGEFYRREMPCIMAILAEIEEDIDTVIVDGYVMLGDRPGLGLYLWEALGGRKTVIGVAKTAFRGASPVEARRPGSRRPLYITAVGIDPTAAAQLILKMHGKHRLPTLLRLADSLTRQPHSVRPD
jgi:deoxyribonuclease V